MAMDTQLTITNRQLAEEILIMEYAEAPAEDWDDVRSEIKRIVDEINLGATRAESAYLNLEVTIES